MDLSFPYGGRNSTTRCLALCVLVASWNQKRGPDLDSSLCNASIPSIIYLLYPMPTFPQWFCEFSCSLKEVKNYSCFLSYGQVSQNLQK